jgi:hypothetical protein
VLHGLERADRHAELVAFLDVPEVQVEDPLAGADGRERHGGDGLLEGAAERMGRIARSQEPVVVDADAVEADPGMPGGGVDGVDGLGVQVPAGHDGETQLAVDPEGDGNLVGRVAIDDELLGAGHDPPAFTCNRSCRHVGGVPGP